MAALATGSLVVSGCATGPELVPGPVSAAADPALGQTPYVAPQPASSGLVVRPKDSLSVTVYRQPDLTFEKLTVNEAGSFEMPLIGTVMAAGHTPAEIREEIASRLAARYLRDPEVMVNIIEYGSHLVTVEGDLARPGVFQFQPDTTLLGAVALAGGPTRTADTSRIALFRTIDGAPMVAVFDLRAIRAGTMIDPTLQPGDRVAIDFSQGARRFQDILSIVPAVGIFSRL